VGTSKTTLDDAPWVEVTIPKPEGHMEIGGRRMVVIAVEDWEQVVEQLRDYADHIETQKTLEDPAEKLVPWDEARKDLFANRIKKVRMRKKITQKELAQRLGMSQPAVSQLEYPDHRPSMETYERVAEVLGCTVEALLAWGEQLMFEHLGTIIALGKVLKDYITWTEKPKLVDFNWIEESGFGVKLKDEGYELRWTDPGKVEKRKLRGWEIVHEEDRDTRTLWKLETGSDRLVLMGRQTG